MDRKKWKIGRGEDYFGGGGIENSRLTIPLIISFVK